MKEYTTHEIAEYIINSPYLMYEDGYYCVHCHPETGLNYRGISDPENIVVYVPCEYAEGIEREEMDAKESESDEDFVQICERLTEKLNEELKKYDEGEKAFEEYMRKLDCD